MAVIYRPTYCTREEVRRAVDVRQAAYANDRIDRAAQSGTEAAEALCQRRFYPQDVTRTFDWPNYQYAYPWRLWLDNWELAAPPTLLVSGSLLPVPIVIPSGSYICQPVNSGPPFTYIELRRDKNYGFGNNTTPQLDIAITGTFGYWTRTRPAGTLVNTITSTATQVQVSDSVSAGVGDVLIAGAERMIITDASYASTGISFSGLTQASAADNMISVPDGTQFVKGEVLLADSEWILVLDVIGNNLICKRAWDGSVLTSHSGGALYARRYLTVVRGALGTTGSAASGGSSLAVAEYPGLIRQLAIAEAVNWLALEPGAYSQATGGLGSGSGLGVTMGASGRGSIKEGVPGIGIPTLRDQVINSKYARKARSRVI